MKTTMTKQRGLPLKTFAAALAATVFSAAAAAESAITVTSFGGTYGKSQIEAMHKPFTAASGIKVLSEDYNGGLAEIRAQVGTGNVKWDVVDVETAEAIRGCDEGLFERVDVAALPKGADGKAATEDFFEGGIMDCAVRNISWSNVVAYDAKRFKGDAPSSLADFFDLKKFPGKRGLKKEPNVNLEWALMADGVAPEQVYAVLGTPEGLQRAFRKLDTIKGSIVWWQAGAQAPQLLADGEVAMTSAYHGRIFNAVRNEKQTFVPVWDGQIQVSDQFAIVKGSKNLAAAKEFLKFATGTKPLAEQAKYVAYAPGRRSSIPLVDESVRSWLPNAGHPGRVLVSNAEWWADHADEINQKFAAWLAK